MISKELLSAVLSKEEIPINICDNMLWMNDDIINIYELAHKCKEWAIRQDFVDVFIAYSLKTCTNIDIKNKSNEVIMYFSEWTEPEAIFKACEWILQQGKQDGKMQSM